MGLIHSDNSDRQARIGRDYVQSAPGISPTVYQARWPQPPIRVILNQLCVEHSLLYLGAGDVLSKRFLSRV